MSSKTDSLSLSAIASAVAALAVKAKDLDTQVSNNREETIKQIVALHKAEATVGRYNQCATATAFMDGLTAGGIAKGTAKNYLTTFRDAVKSGKFEGWNKSRNDAKGKGKGKGKGKAALADLLLKARNHADWAECCEVMQAEYDDDKGTLAEIVDSWLTAQGVEIKDAE